MRIYIFCLILILMALNVSGQRSIYIQIKEKAQEFDTENKLLSAFLIDRYVEAEINYTYHSKRRLLYDTWTERKGDCTDKTILKGHMLKELGIKIRYVHGYADGFRHTWYEFYHEGKWKNFEQFYFNNLKKTGVGVW